MKKKGKVFVGLSGGVDSAVSSALLLKEGYDVVGVFIRTWHPEFLPCNEEEERKDAMRVSAHLGIPFLTFDLEDVYKKEVADYMIEEYKRGRTPNPDVMCNREVKFGAFYKKAIAMGADFVATGHYAQIKRENDSKTNRTHSSDRQRVNQEKHKVFRLCRGVDASKDQSYFLWNLKKKQLTKILFPVGGLEKTETRRLAKKFLLPVSSKKDSQGICFLGNVDLKKFLGHYIKEKKGDVLNILGEVIGKHIGVPFYTIGERKGFTITKKTPTDTGFYIIKKDIKNNTLTVHNDRMTDDRTINLINTNWISALPEKNKKYSGEVRYHGGEMSCKVLIEKSKKAKVIFDTPVLVAEGQSIVIYDNDTCLGGGVVA